MKSFSKRFISLIVVLFMLFGSAPLSGFIGINYFIVPTAEAASSAFLEPYKIVLKWGSTPSDLDSHLEGTLSNGSSFHCYYGNKKIYDNSVLIADLDHDDTSSYGPETITISPSGLTGTYTYYVYNFSGTGSFSGAGATAELYYGDKLVQTVSVPSGSGSGRYWSLFKFVDGKVHLINSVGSSVSSSSGDLINNPAINEVYNQIKKVEECDFSVKVVDGNDNPVRGAEVSVYLGKDRIGVKTSDSDGMVYFEMEDLDTKKSLEKLKKNATVSAHLSVGNDMELCSETVTPNGVWEGTLLKEIIDDGKELKCDEPRWIVPELRVMINKSDESKCKSKLKDYSSLFAQSTNGHVLVNKFKIITVPDTYKGNEKSRLVELACRNDVDICMIRARSNDLGAYVTTDENTNHKYIWCPINENYCAETLCHESGHFLLGLQDEYASAIGFDDYYTKSKQSDFDYSEYNPHNYNLLYAYDYDRNGVLENTNINSSTGREEKAAHWNKKAVDGKWKGAIPRPNGAPDNFGLMEAQEKSIELSSKSTYDNITMNSSQNKTLQYYANDSSCEETLADVLDDKTSYPINFSYAENVQTSKYFYAGGNNVTFTYSSISSSNSVSIFSGESTEASKNEFQPLSSNLIFNYDGSVLEITSQGEAEVLVSNVNGDYIFDSILDNTNAYSGYFHLDSKSNYTITVAEINGDDINTTQYFVQFTEIESEPDFYGSKEMFNLISQTEKSSIVIISNDNTPNIEDYVSLSREYMVTYNNEVNLMGNVELSIELNSQIDYSSAKWFYKDSEKWIPLDTIVDFDDHGNLIAFCTYAGKGSYCLMAKPVTATVVEVPSDFAVTTDDAIYDGDVIVTFDDSDENVMYYNIFYGTEPITAENCESMEIQTVTSSRGSIMFDDSSTTYYFAIQAVGKDGSKSAISESVTCKGALFDSDSDGLPDNWVSLYPTIQNLTDIANADSDDDGLTNIQEYRRGTNPVNPDTDGDNVYDSVEVWYDTNPLEPMTDGVTDDYIVIYGNPDAAIDENSFIVDETTVTCTITNDSLGKAMRTFIRLYSSDGDLLELCEVNLDANSRVDYTFSRDYLEDGMRIVLDEDHITRDTDYSNNEFVYVPAENIIATNPEITLVKGLTAQLEYALTPQGASRIVEWKTADTNIVSVNQKGLITGVRIGKTTITVTTISGFTGTYSVLVEPFPGAGETDFDCRLINNNTELEIIGYYGNDSSVTIPDLIGGYPVTSIVNRAFLGCDFESIVIGSNVTNIENTVFNPVANLKSIEVSDGNSAYSSLDGVLYNFDKTKLVRYPVAKESASFAIPTTVSIIETYAFRDVVNLTSIKIPESAIEIKSYSFTNSTLTNINFAGSKRIWNTINVASNSGLSDKTISYGKYTATFICEGEIISELDYKLGETIVLPDNITDKKYYDFVDWTPAVPETMPDMDLSFTAVYELSNTTNKVDFYVDGELYWSDYRYAGETVNTPETVPSKEGYTFAKWSPNVVDVMPNENLTYEAVWDINKNQVSFVVDEKVYHSYECTYQDSVTSPTAPEKEGYTFVGWTPAVPDTMPDMTLIFTAVFEPVVYTATFMDGEEIIGTDEFIVSDTVLDYPETETVEHYDWVWDDYEIIAGDITVSGRYVPTVYTATFVADGITVDKVEFSVENQTIVAPEVPEKSGYTAAWEEYEIILADFTVNAVYTPIVYIATFTYNGEVIGTDKFTVEDSSLNYPGIEKKEHYEWVWDEHSINASDIIVPGDYVPITYTVKFVSNRKTIKTQTYNVETFDTISAPTLALPNKAGYYSEWENWDDKIGDFTVNEVYVPIEYTASFYCDNVLILTAKFTIETPKAKLPTPKVPPRQGYYVVWDDYSIVPRNIEVHGRTVPYEYTAQFVADGKVVSTQKFTVETEDLYEPPIPQKPGYIARWSYYKIGASNLTINAVYNLPEMLVISRKTLDVSDTYRLLPSCNFEVTEKTFVSSNSSVATVNNNGQVTAVSSGECEITITCYGKDSLGNDIQATKTTKIVVNDNSESSNVKQTLRELFNEFFEVKLYDLVYNFREFISVLLRHAH